MLFFRNTCCLSDKSLCSSKCAIIFEQTTCVRYKRTIGSSETDPISYNFVVENEYSIMKHSAKVALHRVSKSKCVFV